MEEKLERLLIRINLNKEYFGKFNNASIEKVVIDKNTNKWTIFLKLDNILPFNIYKELKDKLIENIHNKINIEIHTNTNDYSNIDEYFKSLIDEISKESTRYKIFKERNLDIDNVNITLKVYNRIEQINIENILDKLTKNLKQYGFNNLNFQIELVKQTDNEILTQIEEEKKVLPPIKYEEKELKEEKKEDKPSYYKVKKATEITKIKDVIYEVENINIEAKIFNIDIFEAKSGYKIITLKVTDTTDSMYVKLFTKSEDEFQKIKELLKNGSWYQFYGKVSMDKFANELVFMTRYKDIVKIDSKNEQERMDNSKEKRVELHTHTMMSQMDGVINEVKLVKTAIKWGHKAIAITDHDGCQAFPHVFNEVTDYNKKLSSPYKDKIKQIEEEIKKAEENKEDTKALEEELNKAKEELNNLQLFKALYGTELEMSDDTLDVVINPTDAEIQNQTYVIFDTETTGFNPGLNDEMIEIGAVKMKNGAVIDSFDELIKPKGIIDSEITNLTGITNAMVRNAKSEEEVTKMFKEWIGDLPLVAHNAKFDKNMLEMAYHKYNLGTLNNTILDTMIISQLINKDLKRHNLTALTKNYGITFEENDGSSDSAKHHHRADYDSEFTGYVFFKMLAQLEKTDIKTFNDLAKLPNELEINMHNRESHINIIAKNRNGLKNMFKLISYASTKYLVKSARIPRHIILEHRDDILLGSGCYNSEIFKTALTRSEDELKKVMEFYDYIEVQPPSNYEHLVARHDINTKEEVIFALNKIINCARELGKLVVATSDAHTLNKEDKIYREIIVNQNVPGKGRHPLSRYLYQEGYMTIPDQYLRTTEEMLEEFSFLDEEVAKEIVIENTNKIADMCEIIEVIIDTGGSPFAPKIENSEETVKELVYNKAKSWYGDPLPKNIEERIEQELKGILGGHFDVIYLIAQKLVKHSNDEGFIVGSRGSVGSSFVATMMGITEVNPLAAHYRCPNCQHSIFEDETGEALGATYSSGFDLPDKECPKCQTMMTKDGQDMPFATFLGFNADKVPDIDLNFSDLNQASAHNYTKVLFGEDNVYRAGTIGTVAEKTAFGYVKGFCEDRNITMRSAEIERIAEGCTGVKRTTGQHPGGIVVIPGYMDVFDFTPFQYPADDPNSAWRTTHFDYHAIDQDVLKLDILGHTDPTQLRMIQELTGHDVTKVPLDDKETMKIFLSPEPLGVTKEQILNETGTLGIPEFGTPFTIGMLTDTKPKTFAELIKISGLSHGTDVWLGNAQELIRSNTVEFKDVIGCRDDIMVYLMYKGVEPLKAFKIMEFVRKGKASKDPETWKGHAESMKKAGIEDWFIDSCQKIKYMFPKAHAAAYVISAFRIAYYKVHHPAIYYATYFSTRLDDFDINIMIKGYNAIKNKVIEINNKGFDVTNKEASILETLKIALEATARGITFGNIDLMKSDSKNFIIDEDGTTLIPPFRTIDGLGGIVAENICSEAKKNPFLSIEEFQKRCKVSTTLVDKMKAMNLFGDLPETSQLSLF